MVDWKISTSYLNHFIMKSNMKCVLSKITQYVQCFFCGNNKENIFIKKLDKLALKYDFQYILFGCKSSQLIYLCQSLNKILSTELNHDFITNNNIWDILSSFKDYENFSLLQNNIVDGTETKLQLKCPNTDQRYWFMLHHVQNSNSQVVFNLLAYTSTNNQYTIKKSIFPRFSKYNDAIHLKESNIPTARCFIFEKLKMPLFILKPKKLPWFVIHNDSLFAKLNLIILLLIVLYAIIVYPFVIAFKYGLSGWLHIIDLIIECILLIQILLRFCTVTKKGHHNDIDCNMKSVAFTYLSTLFILDVLAALPISILSFLLDVELSVLLLSIKFTVLFNIYRLITVLKSIFSHGVYYFIGILTTMMITMHLFACLWYGITYNFDSNTNTYTWLNKLSVVYNQPYEINKDNDRYVYGTGLNIRTSYVSSYYYVLTSYTTIGFGNISPNTLIETILTIILSFIGLITYAILLNQITGILSKYQTSIIKLHSKEKHLKKLFKKYNLNYKKWSPFINSLDQNQTINNTISSTMNNQSLNKINNILPIFNITTKSFQGSFIFDDFPSLKQFTNDPVIISTISSIVTLINIDSNKLFIQKYQPIIHCYMIAKGYAIVRYNDKIVRILEKNDNFGVELNNCFDYQTPQTLRSPYTIETLTNCSIYVIDIFTYLETIEIHPEINDIFKTCFPSIIPLQNIYHESPFKLPKSLANNDNDIPLTNNDDDIPLTNNNDVIPLTTNNDVIPLTNNDDVIPLTNNADVVPLTNNDDVIPLATNDDVIPLTINNDVIPLTMNNDVIPLTINNDVIPQTTDNDVTIDL